MREMLVAACFFYFRVESFHPEAFQSRGRGTPPGEVKSTRWSGQRVSRVRGPWCDDGDITKPPRGDAEDSVEPGMSVTAAKRDGFDNGQAGR